MANGASSDEAANDFFTVKIARDMAHRAVRVEIMIIKAGDARGLLPAMLEGVESKRHHRRSAFCVVDTENPALLAKFVVIKRVGGQHISNPAALRCVAYRHGCYNCLPLVV